MVKNRIGLSQIFTGLHLTISSTPKSTYHRMQSCISYISYISYIPYIHTYIHTYHISYISYIHTYIHIVRCRAAYRVFVAVVTHIGFSGEPLTSCLHPTISSTHTNYSHTYYSHTYYSHKTTQMHSIHTPNTPTHATHTHKQMHTLRA